MPHYYFDVRHGDHLIVDEDGFKLPNIAGVQYQATRSLLELGRDAVLGMDRDALRSNSNKIERMAIEVRNEAGPVLQVNFTFEVTDLIA